jgi:Tol biopolymer transport system component
VPDVITDREPTAVHSADELAERIDGELRRPTSRLLRVGIGVSLALVACGSDGGELADAVDQSTAPPSQTVEAPATGAPPETAPSGETSQDASAGEVPVGRIVFDSDRGDSIDIWYIAAGSDEAVQVTTDPGTDRVASWGPDGTTIIFSSDRSGGPDSPSGLRAYALWIAEADGSGDRHLLGTRTFNHGAVYSPDGSQIAFYSDADGLTQIYVMRADGSGQPTALTDHAGGASGPSWSPDGTEILFSSYDAGNPDVYVMNADGTNVRQLTDDPATDWAGSWSPDGTQIVFSSDRSGDSEIYVMDRDGRNVVRLTDHPARDDAASWAPDGEWIAFATDRDGDREIYVMRIDGSDLRNVTNHPARDDFPSWGE